MSDATFYPRRGVHGALVDALGRDIVSGRLEPDAVIDVAAVRAERDVSLTALREALRVLAGKGLVDARQRRGTVVRPHAAWNQLDPDVLRWEMAEDPPQAVLLEDLAEMRLILEPQAAELAATRRTDADLAALDAHLAEMTRTVHDTAAHADADVAFHRALLAASRNALLARMSGINEALLRARDELVHRHGPREGFLDEHAAIVERVRDRDPEGAAAAVRDMLTRSRDDARAARVGAREPEAAR